MRKEVTFWLIFSSSFLSVFTEKTYGPFNMELKNFDVCTGPKTKDCAIFKVNIIGKNIIDVNVQVIEKCSPSKGKIVAMKNSKSLLRLQMNKPCEHLFLRPLFTAVFNATENCEILKGTYSMKVDLGQIFNSYARGKFVYGNNTYKTVLYSDKCNFSCASFTVEMTPK